MSWSMALEKAHPVTVKAKTTAVYQQVGGEGISCTSYGYSHVVHSFVGDNAITFNFVVMYTLLTGFFWGVLLLS